MLPFLAHRPVPDEKPARPGPRRRDAIRDGALVVELCGPTAIEAHVAAWTDLARRAVEPNVFMEPGFALPAALHLTRAERPLFLLCWDQIGDQEPVLLGLLAIHGGRSFAAPVAAAWHHPQWVTSAPLLDAVRGAQAFDAILGWLAMTRGYRGGLVLRGVPVGGPLRRLIDDGGRRGVAVLDTRSRAILGPADPASGLAPKQLKELRRQRRRLGSAVAHRSARSVDEVCAATERFLDLEARGWKGARGTALLADPHLATFTRTMTRLMAMQGRCRIDALEVDGKPVAMGIVLRSGDRAFYWKTAYDEAYRRQSPGKLLAQEIGAVQQADPSVAMTDSCAIPDHPMIDAVWTGRMQVADLLIASPRDSGKAFARAALRLRLARAARQLAKQAVQTLRKRLSRR